MMTVTIKICIHLDNDENILKNKYLVFQGLGMLKFFCQNFLIQLVQHDFL